MGKERNFGTISDPLFQKHKFVFCWKKFCFFSGRRPRPPKKKSFFFCKLFKTCCSQILSVLEKIMHFEKKKNLFLLVSKLFWLVPKNFSRSLTERPIAIPRPFLGSKTFGRENIFVNLVQKIFDRFVLESVLISLQKVWGEISVQKI